MQYEQKWAVASFFDAIEIGYTFPRDDVPLHATLAGVFAVDMQGSAIAAFISDAINEFKAFSVVAHEIEQWGPIQVATLHKSEEFNNLYTTIQEVLLEKGAVFNEPQYLMDGFTPHVTHQKTAVLRPKEHATVRSVSLVDMFPDKDGEKRRIISTVNLRQND